MNKKQARLRRAAKTRKQIRLQVKARLCVHKTPRHIYAQLISADAAQILVAASTVEQDLKAQVKYTGNCEAAQLIGKVVAERAVAKGITEVAFDRSGFPFHGRIKALAESAREQGLKF